MRQESDARSKVGPCWRLEDQSERFQAPTLTSQVRCGVQRANQHHSVSAASMLSKRSLHESLPW